MRRKQDRRLRPLAVAAAMVVAGAVVATAPAGVGQAAPASPPSCPTAVKTDEIKAGQAGTGYTVVAGKQPVTFGAEVLGVYRDAVLPGIDLVIAKLSGAPIDQAGGVWYGMSGSPVFVGDQLLGAVSYKLSYGPSDIVGLTAGEDIRSLAGDPARSSAAAPKDARIGLSAGMERTIAAAADVPATSFGESLVPLPLPFSVSGLGTRGLSRLSNQLQRGGVSARVYAGSSLAPGTAGNEAELVPGSNFAAALSYGVLTAAAVGTTSIRCEQTVVAFGHPFDAWEDVAASAGTASAIAIIKDPLDSPYKMATVDGAVGMLDFDGFTGVRADLDKDPATVKVESKVFGEDTNRAVEGATAIVSPDYVPWISADHLYASGVGAMLRFSGGSSQARFEVTLRRHDGTTQTLPFRNTYVSSWDAPWPAAGDLQRVLSRLQHNAFEKVSVTGVNVPSARIRREQRRATITGVLVAVGNGAYRAVDKVVVRPGAVLHLKIRLKRQDGTTASALKDLRVPTTALGRGHIEVVGGPHSREVRPAPTTFDQLMTSISTRVTNNNLAAKLWMGERVVNRSREALDRVVRGYKTIAVEVRR